MTLAAMTDQQTQQMLYGGVILIVIMIMGFVAIMVFKHYWKRDEGGNDAVGFSLSELKAMRDRGEITIQEYEQTRANVIARVKAQANKPKPAKPKRDEPGRTDLAE